MNAFSSNPCIDKIDVSDYKLLTLKFLNRNKKYEVIAFLTVCVKFFATPTK